MSRKLSVAAFAFAVAAAGSSAALAQGSGSPAAKGTAVEQELIAIDEKCSAARRDGNASLVSECFTDDFLGLNADGVAGTKADVMKSLTQTPPAPLPPGLQPDPAQYTVKMYGSDAAVVMHVTKGSPGGTAVMHTFVRQQGRWKMASSAAVTDAEVTLNRKGYELLQAGKTQAALDVFKLNVQLYPDSWNTYDSLGEAYAAAGQKDLAIQNYEKSVQLNPKNDSGKDALTKLRGK